MLKFLIFLLAVILFVFGIVCFRAGSSLIDYSKSSFGFKGDKNER